MIKNTGFIALFLLIVYAFVSYSNKKPKETWIIKYIQKGSILHNKQKYTYNNNKQVLIYYPKKRIKNVLILLHGWNGSKLNWKNKTNIKEYADKHGIVLIAPEMNKSNYMTQYYKETKHKWNSVPGTLWIGKVIIPFIKNNFTYENLYILGVSTGARGAVLVAENFPIFDGVGYLSGDFDICKLNDKISQDSYGPLHKYKKRWEKDNTSLNADKLIKSKIFAAHSIHDKITPVSQTILMKKILKNLKIKSLFEIDNFGSHSWRYWNKKLKSLFNYWFKTR